MCRCGLRESGSICGSCEHGNGTSRVPQKARICLTDWATISFSTVTLLQEVSELVCADCTHKAQNP
jgi:hypothetical protein